MDKVHTRQSKFLSLVLRHAPERIGLKLDPEGWADIDELLSKCATRGGPRISRDDLIYVVEHNNKRRFELDVDEKRIRASQGHSIDVDLRLTPVTPPEILFHGTALHNIEPIEDQGLVKGRRQHVHLSQDVETAKTVGSRHGKPTVLEVDAQRMHLDGFEFYQSKNGVWLTDHVPPRYLRRS